MDPIELQQHLNVIQPGTIRSWKAGSAIKNLFMESDPSFYHGVLATENQFNLELTYKGDEYMNEIISNSADLVALRTIQTVQPISNPNHKNESYERNYESNHRKKNLKLNNMIFNISNKSEAQREAANMQATEANMSRGQVESASIVQDDSNKTDEMFEKPFGDSSTHVPPSAERMPVAGANQNRTSYSVGTSRPPHEVQHPNKNQVWMKVTGCGNFLDRSKLRMQELLVLFAKGILTPEDVRFGSDTSIKGTVDSMQINVSCINVGREAFSIRRDQQRRTREKLNPQFVTPVREKSLKVDPENSEQFLINDNIIEAEFAKPACEPESEDMDAKDATMFAGMEQLDRRFDETHVMVEEHGKSISELFLLILDKEKAAEDRCRHLRDRINHTEVNLANMANALKSFGNNAITFDASQAKGLND